MVRFPGKVTPVAWPVNVTWTGKITCSGNDIMLKEDDFGKIITW
jgi:hypothetical protein